jgi:choline-sulfatase
LDQQIGKIWDTLAEQQMLENTLVILTSDHGEMLGDHHAFGKRTYFEASARIPLVMSWPSKLPQDETRQQLAVLTDLYATIVTAAGGSLPEDCYSQTLLAAADFTNQPHRDEVFGEFGLGRMLKFMRRWDDYKYVYHTNGGMETLFHLKDDPDELHNLAASLPEICLTSRARLVQYYQQYSFSEALEGDELKIYESKKYTPAGFLNQYPKWPQTV